MNVGSLFSGIGGLDLGLARAGFRHAFLCESDPWRRSVLAQHFPGVPIYEDVCLVGEPTPRVEADGYSDEPGASGREAGAGLPGGSDVALLCGGFPCQDVSVAGRRVGLAGERSGLFYEFARIAESLRPRFILVENVPGLLSSNGGRDFGAVIGTLADIGYGVAWRILDSRYFGVPQRRRRVFILGALADGDPRDAAERCGEILAVGTRCERHPAARGEAREGVAYASADGAHGSRVAGTFGALTGGVRSTDLDGNGAYITSEAEVSQLESGNRPVRLPGYARVEAGAGSPEFNDDECPMCGWEVGSNLTSCGECSKRAASIAVAMNLRGREHGANPELDDLASLRAASGGSSRSYVADTSVRRLTPTECERLQALPDGWTDFGPDSRRYAALGDAVTASVSEYISRRLIAA